MGIVLEELADKWPVSSYVVGVGLNGTTDRSAEIAAAHGALIGETSRRGYGHGCIAAIEALQAAGITVDAYLFMAGDGANDPADLQALIRRYEEGAELVIGQRTTSLPDLRRPIRRVLANLALGSWATLLSGHCYSDLGPFRIIERNLFEKMALRELTWGWTIEAQIVASRLGASIATERVGDRPRIAGTQKISGVSLKQTVSVGAAIARAGLRAATRPI